jgi:hypothetical protein
MKNVKLAVALVVLAGLIIGIRAMRREKIEPVKVELQARDAVTNLVAIGKHKAGELATNAERIATNVAAQVAAAASNAINEAASITTNTVDEARHELESAPH